MYSAVPDHPTIFSRPATTKMTLSRMRPTT
jgi:hypothetical protein